jgi:cephalosporin-C deacetylase-like acetyl esterase
MEFKFYLLAPRIHIVATCFPNYFTFPRVVCDFLHTLAMLAEFNRSENTSLLKIRGGLSVSVAAFSQRMKKQQAYYFSLCSFRPDGGVCWLWMEAADAAAIQSMHSRHNSNAGTIATQSNHLHCEPFSYSPNRKFVSNPEG